MSCACSRFFVPGRSSTTVFGTRGRVSPSEAGELAALLAPFPDDDPSRAFNADAVTAVTLEIGGGTQRTLIAITPQEASAKAFVPETESRGKSCSALRKNQRRVTRSILTPSAATCTGCIFPRKQLWPLERNCWIPHRASCGKNWRACRLPPHFLFSSLGSKLLALGSRSVDWNSR